METFGLCGCGCGGSAPIAKRTVRDRGWIKGQPVKFIRHHAPKADFWSLVTKGDGCWEWQGQRNRGAGRDYGRFFLNGRNRLAHRVSWALANGPIPVGVEIRHKCDNPPCVRPDHLELGTHLENMHDRTLRGRQNPAAGERNRGARHASGETGAAIARSVGVSQTMVSYIVTGRNWRRQN